MVGIQGQNQFSAHRLERVSNDKRTAFERLSSGKRINRAADDAAGLAISERIAALEAGLAQGVRNLGDGVGLVRVAEGTLGQSSDILIRMRELSVQAQNGTLNDSDRATIQEEFDSLSAEIDRIAQSTEFNGQKLLDGSASGEGAISFENGTNSENSSTTVSIDDQSAAALGLTGLDASSPAAIAAIDTAIDSVSSARAQLGAAEASLRSQINSIGVAQETAAAARSRIVDTDIASAAADLTKNAILEQGQLSLRAQAMRLSSQAVLGLLT